MVYIDYWRSGDVVVVARGIGTRAPLATSAARHTFLAAAGDREREYPVDLLVRDGEKRKDVFASIDAAAQDL